VQDIVWTPHLVKNKVRLVVGVYVVDLIIMGESDQELSMFKEEMKRVFWMSDLSALSYTTTKRVYWVGWKHILGVG
jgi:hypothetical protein